MNLLLEATMKVSVILAMALMASALLRSQSAALKHWVLAVAVACSLAVPLLVAVVPVWYQLPVSGLHPLAARSMQSSGTTNEASLNSAPRDVTSEVAFSRLASLLVLCVGLGRLWWLALHARSMETGRWPSLAEEICRACGHRFSLRLLHSRHPSLLVTWGWRRARILLPAAAEEWSDDQIRVVLAHELAHIARGDWVAQLAAEVLRAIYWFNPILWVACRRLRTESECACDDAVLARGVDGHAYATHLLALARRLNSATHPWLPAPAMARPTSLEGRVRAMLNTTRNRRPVAWPVRVAIIVGLVAMTLPVSGVRAQSSFYSFTGTVLDSTGRTLPQTRVVLTDAARQAIYAIRTNDAGRFEFIGLPPATYALEVARPGFASLAETFTVSGDAEREIRLNVGSLEESITVSNQMGPAVPPDAATLKRREEARQQFVDMRQREMDRCATGGAGSAIGGQILPPAKTRDVRPVYPAPLMASSVGGTVTMDAVIGLDGRVHDVRNVKGPHPDLEAAAVTAVRQWEFTPTLLNCEPIDVSMKVTTTFRIQP